MSKAIYLDVGAWQSSERGLPLMEFAVLENNFIALCTFIIGDCGYKPIPQNGSFNYLQSNTHRFLTELLKVKLQDSHVIKIPIAPEDTFLFIKQYMIFDDHALLNENDKLIVMIPDLHLHFFKNSICDNFITWYEDRWHDSSGAYRRFKLKNRRSMEIEFCHFLQGIRNYQKSGGNVNTFFLGDFYDMWETNALIEAFCIMDNASEYYKGIDALIEDLRKGYKGTGLLKDFLNDVKTFKFEESKLDSRLSLQLNTLKSDVDLTQKLYIYQEKGNSLRDKANFMATEIGKKYHSKEGEPLLDILNGINWKFQVHGNHDNFLFLNSDEPNHTFRFSNDLECPPLSPTFSSNNCELLFDHGHAFDWFNDDIACGCGYFLTLLCALLEAKGAGDLIKGYASRFQQKDLRLDYMKRIASLFFNWDKNQAIASKNKVIVLAHTHIPYLYDMTNDYFIWASTKKSIEEGKTGITNKGHVNGFFSFYKHYICNQPVPLQKVPDQTIGVYISARDLRSLPIGIHQFTILVPRSTAALGIYSSDLIDLGNGVRGIVIGINPINSRLTVAINNPDDVNAAKEFFDNSRIHWYTADWDAEVYKITIPIPVDVYIEEFLRATTNYIGNEAKKNIHYRALKGPNCHSWNQSIHRFLRASDVPDDLFGVDPGEKVVIDDHYFQ